MPFELFPAAQRHVLAVFEAAPRREVDVAPGLMYDNHNIECMPPGFSPHEYTSGRWLRLDKQQRQARNITFDFQLLCKKAVASIPGAQSIAQCTKIEGGFNRAFIFKLNNGTSVVARVPFSIAGPPRITTNSEVATMEYVRRNTSIPVPDVLDWSDDPQNPVGCEYIIMAYAVGVQLHQRWPTMTVPEHLQVVQALGRFAQELYKLQFPAFGSLYFANAPIEKSKLIPIGNGFSIGPHCGNRYWPGQPGDERSYECRPPNAGPWTSHEQYCRGLVDVGYSRIPLNTPPGRMKYQGTVDEHLLLAGTAEQTLLLLAQSDALKSVSRPMLLHRDMHKRNIFVSQSNPTQITSLIDWQSSSIEPVYHYSDEIPNLCEFPDTWDEAEIEQQEPTTEQRAVMKSVSICRRAWEVILQGWTPELHRSRAMDQDWLRLFRFVPSAWRHGVVPIRDDLIELSKHWSQPLRLPGSCPYQPSAADLEQHKALWTEFEMAREVRKEVIQGLRTDEEGWVPIDRWEDTKQTYDLLYRGWQEEVVERGEMTEEIARKVWPFDSPENDASSS